MYLSGCDTTYSSVSSTLQIEKLQPYVGLKDLKQDTDFGAPIAVLTKL